MSVTRRRARCAVEDVFAVLSDGWLYGSWVPGAARVRAVEPHWPAAGSALHHSVGIWPAMISDSTHVLTVEPPHRLLLKARSWPVGEAEVLIELTPAPAGCEIAISEDATAGPALMIPAPVRHLLLDARNREALRRLAYLAERRTGP